MYFIAKGGIYGYPKNTKEAIALTNFDNDIDGVLIDVRMTKDSKLVLYEDDLIDNYFISKTNYNELKNIRIGNSIDNYHIPLLEEVLIDYQKEYLIINLHHNYDQNEILVNELKNILENYAIKNVIVLTDDDNLYDYLKILTDLEVYKLRDNDKFIDIDIVSKNKNNNIIIEPIIGDNYELSNYFKNKTINSDIDNIFILTNNVKLLKEYNK